jgi:hypothetical protein
MSKKEIRDYQEGDKGTIVVRVAYMDMFPWATAVFLSRLHLYYLPIKTGIRAGKCRAKVQRKGKYWIVKSMGGWATECHLSIVQLKDATKELEQRGIIEKETHLVDGKRVLHLRYTLANGDTPIDDSVFFKDLGTRLHNNVLVHKKKKLHLSAMV